MIVPLQYLHHLYKNTSMTSLTTQATLRASPTISYFVILCAAWLLHPALLQDKKNLLHAQPAAKPTAIATATTTVLVLVPVPVLSLGLGLGLGLVMATNQNQTYSRRCSNIAC